MPALAGIGRVTDAHALAVETAILVAILDRTVASRMLALVGFLFGHDCLLSCAAPPV